MSWQGGRRGAARGGAGRGRVGLGEWWEQRLFLKLLKWHFKFHLACSTAGESTRMKEDERLAKRGVSAFLHCKPNVAKRRVCRKNH